MISPSPVELKMKTDEHENTLNAPGASGSALAPKHLR